MEASLAGSRDDPGKVLPGDHEGVIPDDRIEDHCSQDYKIP